VRDRSSTLPEKVGNVHGQYDNDDARVCEEAYEESEVILGEAELFDFDVEQEWTAPVLEAPP
jgi:hypothetical protein